MSAHSVQPFGRYWEHLRMFCFIREIFGYFTINKKLQPITLFKKEILPNTLIKQKFQVSDLQF